MTVRSRAGRPRPGPICLVGLFAASALAACGPSAATPPPTAGTELTVFAAASLKNAIAQARLAYEAAHPGVRLVVSTDSSAALATKIEQGAVADVFLSADVSNADRLVGQGLTDRGSEVFAANALTVIVPSGNPARITSPADLARAGVRIIAAADAVPITRYATELVANLATQPSYPADFASRYAANVVSREENVAAVVVKVELGEGDAAIVYRTDAEASTRLERVPVPDTANVRADYAGVVLKGSGQVQPARDFLEWLRGADGQRVLASFGFLPPT